MQLDFLGAPLVARVLSDNQPGRMLVEQMAECHARRNRIAPKSRLFLCPTVRSERCGRSGDHPTCCKGRKLARPARWSRAQPVQGLQTLNLGSVLVECRRDGSMAFHIKNPRRRRRLSLQLKPTILIAS